MMFWDNWVFFKLFKGILYIKVRCFLNVFNEYVFWDKFKGSMGYMLLGKYMLKFLILVFLFKLEYFGINLFMLVIVINKVFFFLL